VQELGVHVEESANAPGAETTLPFDDTAFAHLLFVDFVVAGAEAAGEFRCTDCGYGAVVHRTLPPCPMCGGSIWENRGPLEQRVD
jgi:rubrerythrin